jgi:hypothetical protein
MPGLAPLPVLSDLPPPYGGSDADLKEIRVVVPTPRELAWIRFVAYATTKEFTAVVTQKLFDTLSNTLVVLVCDDSTSMRSQIKPESGKSTVKPVTRWDELRMLAAEVIELVTAINPHGIDVHFLNRANVFGCTSVGALQASFANPPVGNTPIVRTLDAIYNALMIDTPETQQVLFVVVTDGEPSGGGGETLFGLKRCIQKITNTGRMHVSFAECTDDEETMAFLDTWDGQIRNFDNTDDYREELRRVRIAQNDPAFKFDRADYVRKILLATYDRWYYNLDQTSVAVSNYSTPNYSTSSTSSQSNRPQEEDCCSGCCIL